MSDWKGEVRKNGLVAYQETANTTGKNASDIGMVIDAMDILHGGRLNGFVIVSSDSDFTRLASRIREHGLDVIGMGEKKSPQSFIQACQRFIYLENLIEEDEAPKKSAKASDKEPAPKKATKQNPTNAIPLITRAMDKMDSADDWYALGPLGQHILRANSDFDPRTYGKKKLSELVASLKRFETKKDGTSLYVRRVD